MLQPPTILFGILTDLLFWFSFHLSIFLAHSSICLLPLFFNFPFFSSLPHSESSPLFHPPKKLIKNKFSIFLHIRFSLVPTPKFSKLFFFFAYSENWSKELQNVHLIFFDNCVCTPLIGGVGDWEWDKKIQGWYHLFQLH